MTYKEGKMIAGIVEAVEGRYVLVHVGLGKRVDCKVAPFALVSINGKDEEPGFLGGIAAGDSVRMEGTADAVTRVYVTKLGTE